MTEFTKLECDIRTYRAEYYKLKLHAGFFYTPVRKLDREFAQLLFEEMPAPSLWFMPDRQQWACRYGHGAKVGFGYQTNKEEAIGQEYLTWVLQEIDRLQKELQSDKSLLTESR